MVYYTRKRKLRLLTSKRYLSLRNPWRFDKLHIPLSQTEALKIAQTFKVKVPYLHGSLSGKLEKIETSQRDKEVVLYSLRLGKGIFCVFAPFGFWISVKANRRCLFEVYRSHRWVFRYLLKIRFREFLNRISYFELFHDRPPACGIVIDPPRKWTRSKKRFTYTGNNGLKTTYVGARGYKQVVVYQKPSAMVKGFKNHSGFMEKKPRKWKSRLEIRLWGRRHKKLLRHFLTFITKAEVIEDVVIFSVSQIYEKHTGRDPPFTFPLRGP